MVAKGECVGNGRNGRLWLGDASFYIQNGSKQGPTVWHKELFQYPVTSHNGRLFKKKNVYKYIHTHIYN